jgi:CubicO group peptidase (beta-lactamase class C family)
MKISVRRHFLFVILAAAALAQAPRQALAQIGAAAPAKSVAAALQPFVDNHSLAGAVTLVADHEKIISLQAVGFADVAAGKPMQTDALFWIASQSKPMTATALMMLVDERKVSLDDPVAKFLPEFNDQWLAVERGSDHVLLKKPAQRVTVRPRRPRGEIPAGIQ